MKSFIRKRLRENINEVTEGGEYIAYHGSPYKIKKFTDEFVGSEKATDQEGPGIYFTTSFDDAAGYGKYVYKVKLSPRKLLDLSEDKKIPKHILIKLIKMKSDWKMNAQDWAENPDIGAKKAVEDAYDYNDNEKDVFLQIWIDFYRYHVKMVALSGNLVFGVGEIPGELLKYHQPKPDLVRSTLQGQMLRWNEQYHHDDPQLSGL